MKNLSIIFSLLFTIFLVGCEKQAPTPTKTQVKNRTLIIAGMPVYEKDYRLLAKN